MNHHANVPRRVAVTLFVIVVLGLFSTNQQPDTMQWLTIGKDMPPWKEGYLDFHHIHTGVSVSTFVVFPDGTTMLIDAGDMDLVRYNQNVQRASEGWRAKLRAANVWPNNSHTTGGWVLAYLHRFWPRDEQQHKLDYVLVTHFHADHIGDVYASSSQERGRRSSDYIQTGIVQVGDEMDIGTIMDRGYDVPYDLEKEWESDPFQNYLKFVRAVTKDGGTKLERFEVGSTSQITMKRKKVLDNDHHHFMVRNIKANLNVSAALPGNHTVYNIEGDILRPHKDSKYGIWDENKLSAAIVVEYDDFRYYEGADQEYHRAEYPYGLPPTNESVDTVTPTALAAGRVDVATLNHHGHGILPVFCTAINPRVLILQGWCNSHPPREQLELLLGDSPRDLFATFAFPSHIETLGKKHLFQSTLGHVVVRVLPKTVPQKQEYHIYVLDSGYKVSKHFGPYTAGG